MKKYLIGVGLLFATALVSAAISIPIGLKSSAIDVALTASRTSGVGPLGVTFSAVGTTSTAVTGVGDCNADPTIAGFHCIQYTWNFGDTAGTCAGLTTWSNGAATSASRNTATGPVAGHVYDPCLGVGTKTYSACVTAFDGTNTSPQVCTTISVTDPTTVYSGTNTICFSGTGVFTGCPSGATQTTQASFTTALASCTANIRCLWRKGETFTTSGVGNLSTTGMTLGAFGTGALPIISSTNVGGVITLAAGAGDIRIVDLDIQGAGSTDTGTTVSISGGAIPNITFLRLQIADLSGTSIRGGITGQTGSKCTGCVIQDNVIVNYGGGAPGGYGIFGGYSKTAILGNLVGASVWNAFGPIRIQPAQYIAFVNNTIGPAGTGGGGGSASFTLRALEHAEGDPRVQDTYFNYLADNKITGSNSATETEVFQIQPASLSQNNWIYDTLMERNWLIFGTTSQHGFYGQSVRLTARNNICDASAATAGRSCFSNDSNNTAGAPASRDQAYYNNTCFGGTGAGSMYCIFLDLQGPGFPVINTRIKNNVVYAPSAVGGTTVFQYGGDAGANNTTGASGTLGNTAGSAGGVQYTTCPKWVDSTCSVAPVNPIDFKPLTNSYTINGAAGHNGNVNVPFYTDFGQVTRTNGSYDAGAWQH